MKNILFKLNYACIALPLSQTVRVHGTLTTADNSYMVMTTGGTAKNVFWSVDYASLGKSSRFKGNLIAHGAGTGCVALLESASTTGKIVCLNGQIILNKNSIDRLIDTDGDGVYDDSDDFPKNIKKAYSITTPSSTLAFEDQWPSKGDFDMNDLVMRYTNTIIANGANLVLEVQGTFDLMATGGNFHNGFAIEFPVNSSEVTGVTGATLEAGSDKAVVMLLMIRRC